MVICYTTGRIEIALTIWQIACNNELIASGFVVAAQIEVSRDPYPRVGPDCPRCPGMVQTVSEQPAWAGPDPGINSLVARRCAGPFGFESWLNQCHANTSHEACSMRIDPTNHCSQTSFRFIYWAAKALPADWRHMVTNRYVQDICISCMALCNIWWWMCHSLVRVESRKCCASQVLLFTAVSGGLIVHSR